MPLDDLPHVDEHVVDLAVPPERAWAALVVVLRGTFGGAAARGIALALGCEPSATYGWQHPEVGSTVPGFCVTRAEPPGLLVLAGRHRFSRYGIVFRIEASGGGCRVLAETRARFPGPHGALYRLAVIGTGAHVVGTRRMLRSVVRVAERAAGTGAP